MEVKRNAFLRMIDFIAASTSKFLIFDASLCLTFLIAFYICYLCNAFIAFNDAVYISVVFYPISFVLALFTEAIHRKLKPYRKNERADRGLDFIRGVFLLYIILPLLITMTPIYVIGEILR